MTALQLKCRYESHTNEDIIAVCVNKECKETRVCCFTCFQDGHHDKHKKEILQLSVFQQWQQEGVTYFNQFRYQFKQSLKEIENLTSIINQFLFYNQEVIDQNSGCSTITQLEGQINQINRLTLIDNQIRNYLNELILAMQGIKNILNNSQPSTNELCIKSKVEVQQQQPTKIVSTQEKIIQNIVEQPKIITVIPQKLNIRFDEKEKIQDIKIYDNGRCSSQNILTCTSSQIVVCTPQLPINESTFVFRQNKGSVGVGICIREIVTQSKYQLNRGRISHGCYLIKHDGCAYSHHDSELNDKHKSFKFSKDDKITVIVDIGKGKIGWLKQATKERFEMELDPKGGNDYCACVCLNVGGSIEIVDDY